MLLLDDFVEFGIRFCHLISKHDIFVQRRLCSSWCWQYCMFAYDSYDRKLRVWSQSVSVFCGPRDWTNFQEVVSQRYPKQSQSCCTFECWIFHCCKGTANVKVKETNGLVCVRMPCGYSINEFQCFITFYYMIQVCIYDCSFASIQFWFWFGNLFHRLNALNGKNRVNGSPPCATCACDLVASFGSPRSSHRELPKGATNRRWGCTKCP